MASFWISAGQIEVALRKAKGAWEKRSLGCYLKVPLYPHKGILTQSEDFTLRWLEIGDFQSLKTEKKDWLPLRLLIIHLVTLAVNPGAECFQKPPAIRHLRHRTKGELHTYHFKNHQHFENLCWKIGGRNKMNSLSCHRMKAYRIGVFIWKGTRWLSKKHVNILQRPCRDITVVIFASRTKSLQRTYIVGYL